MTLRLTTALAVCGLAFAASPDGAWAQETNLWPFRVSRPADPPEVNRTSWAGPLGFSQTATDGSKRSGVRPFYEQDRRADGTVRRGSFIYPLAHWHANEQGEINRWSVLNLVNASGRSGTEPRRLDVWPFYFSRDTGHPETSYAAWFPLHGEMQQRLGQDRVRWTLFPLYGRFEKRGEVTTTTPWPFIKTVSGPEHRGFEVWPLAGWREHTGRTHERWMLWPLVYDRKTGLDTAQPSRQAGVLPFYALDRSPGYRSDTYLWPFFGTVRRTEPYRYEANHYLWPLWVRGSGDDRHVERWAPFYSHSSRLGRDKTWLMWPLWRHTAWHDDSRAHEQRQVLYFLYHETTQRSLARPDLPAARKVHLWPLVSAWDNGAGRRQVQALSPFEVFFPHNEITRRLWTPLFALYRFDQPEPGRTRHALLWDAVTLTRDDTAGTRAFHLGPLAGYEASAREERVSLLAGLLGLQRKPGTRVWYPYFGSASPPVAEARPSSAP